MGILDSGVIVRVVYDKSNGEIELESQLQIYRILVYDDDDYEI